MPQLRSRAQVSRPRVEPEPEPESFIARDGAHLVLHCRGWRLAHGSSRRRGVARWSEVSVWRLVNREILVSKVGVSTVVHLPGCMFTSPAMTTWAETAPRDMPPFFTGCLICDPDITEMDPQTVLEVTRHRATLYPDAMSAVVGLYAGRAGADLPRLVRVVLAQCARSDPGFRGLLPAAAVTP